MKKIKTFFELIYLYFFDTWTNTYFIEKDKKADYNAKNRTVNE